MTPAPIVASLAEQPAYYALYALYTDYLVNNAYHREREYFAKLREIVTYIQPLVGKEQPYLPSWSLRLFTERSARERLPPEHVSAAWRLVRQMVEEIGPPVGWASPRRALPRRGRPVRRTPPTSATPSAPPARRAYPPPPIRFDFAV